MAQFKARARALEMLGRQQIAGIPTAISELFKNAHDAYANNVVVDYYRSDRLFVLRDDGIGMTKKDFEDRWLALGTDSKLGASTSLSLPPIDPSKKPRAILGEKGIGRLAIAAIGDQVLIMTRAVCDTQPQLLVVAFIHWGLFECPGLDLSEIDFPLEEFANGQIPTQADVQALCDKLTNFVTQLGSRMPDLLSSKILHDIQSFKIDPVQVDRWVGAPSLTNFGNGTQFIIYPANPSLTVNIEEKPDVRTAPQLVKSLIGFSNTMTPDHEPPPMHVSFRYHRTDEYYDDLIDEDKFFTPDEFINADHRFRGTFDEYGQFRGSVSVYGEVTNEYEVPWSGSRGAMTDCGPFKIDLAYIPGRASLSTIPNTQWATMDQKLVLHGGLYIYRDAIRVLPYGDSDVDFLDIEKRRSQGLSYYYFSYRRMFGVIQISRSTNGQLNEKAGREGFQQNKAYREFKAILINFFTQVAGEFFREGGMHAETFLAQSSEMERAEKARRKWERLADGKRERLQKSLDQFFSDVDSSKPIVQSKSILDELTVRLDSTMSVSDAQIAARELLQIEAWARKELSTYKDLYRVTKPAGLGLTKLLRRHWDAYVIERAKLETTVFAETSKQMFSLIAATAHKANVVLDRRLRVERIIVERGEIARDTIKKDAAITTRVGDDVRQRVRRIVRDCQVEIDGAIRQAEVGINSLDVKDMQDDGVSRECERLEALIVGTLERKQEALSRVNDLLSAITDFDSELSNSESIPVERQAANEEEILALRDQVSQNLELSHLGMAISVVDHEFGAVVRELRRGLRSLKPFADTNRRLHVVYGDLLATFESLDAYLKLFTPLQRRLYRKKIEFHGRDIDSFVANLFSERLRRHHITLVSTPAFQDSIISGYPSTFYPVFVNLVDNAIFWSPQPRIADPWIRLDADNGELIVTDSGPGVPLRDRKVVFDFGFTRKPGGRGIGLYVSREMLKGDGFLLTVEDAPTGRGTAFRVAPDGEGESPDNDEEASQVDDKGKQLL
ncbi:MAG: ATP-binding protein [Capsulimonadaceae bacterium]